MSADVIDHIEVTNARYVSGYKIHLSFNDGTERLVDFKSFLDKARNPDTAGYRDLKKFREFNIHEGDLVWGDYQMIFPIMDLHEGTICPDDRYSSIRSKQAPKMATLMGKRRASLKNRIRKVPAVRASAKRKVISLKSRKRLQRA